MQVLFEEEKYKERIAEKGNQIKEKENQLLEKEKEISKKNEEIQCLKDELRRKDEMEIDMNSASDFVADSFSKCKHTGDGKKADVDEDNKTNQLQARQNGKATEIATSPNTDTYNIDASSYKSVQMSNLPSPESRKVIIPYSPGSPQVSIPHSPGSPKANIPPSIDIAESMSNTKPWNSEPDKTHRQNRPTEDCKITINIAQQQGISKHYTCGLITQLEKELLETKEYATKMEKELSNLRQEKQALSDELRRLEKYLNSQMDNSRRVIEEMKRTNEENLAKIKDMLTGLFLSKVY